MKVALKNLSMEKILFKKRSELGLTCLIQGNLLALKKYKFNL